jgi:hypothetical protein
VYAGRSSVSVKWAGDDIANLPSSAKVLLFDRLHKPESDMMRHRTLEVAASDLNSNNSGRRFHFVLTPDSPAVIEACAIEARVRGEDWATDYGA